MKILNITSGVQNEILYTISKFPDGQQDVTISTVEEWCFDDPKKTVIQIKARFNNFKDLEIIVCATKALRRMGVKEIHLYIPYLLGARSDRQFQEGGNSYLVDIIAPIINSLSFESVVVVDIHSDVAAACINNLKVVDNLQVVKFALADLWEKEASNIHDDIVLISPDGGSLKKIYKVADAVGYKGNIICCSKSRDNEGKLSKVNVPLNNFSNKDLIIIDDICDGGATFINITKTIKEHYIGHSCPKIYLIVTHGIFSRGFGELQQYFEAIYTTNSYQDLNPDTQQFVKQLNIF